VPLLWLVPPSSSNTCPTSSLDPTTEALIRNALERLMRDRTVLIVAHRLNTIYTADQIAVLDQGRLVELGRHDDLLRRDGSYSTLVRAGTGERV
jgi:ABC-type multidrug transport system fused ATPase/permease subunit